MIKKMFTSIILILVLLASVSGQEFRNLDFRQKCDSSKTGLCYWDLSWGEVNDVRPDMSNDKTILLIEGKSEKSVGFVEQPYLPVDFNDIQILSISANIKSESVIGKGAGLNIGIYDSERRLIANKDMGGFYSINWVKGTNEWKKYSISVVCPIETREIKVGMILYGIGQAWFSDFDVLLTPIDSRKPSKLALEYITAAIDTIAKNSLVRDSLDTISLKETALKIAGPAKNYSDCFLAINFLLESLRTFGDHHSFFMSADELYNWETEGSEVSEITFPSYKVVDSCGYILVPPFHGGNPKQMLAYADSLQLAVEKLYKSEIKGWIVDLRQNTGGNMEPMITGLGPLFSAIKLGSLIDINGTSDSWYYKEGKYYTDSYEGWAVSNPYKLPMRLPVAVLTGNQTGSSGEVVVISFIGNARTKIFGEPTWGLTTGNGSFELMDGSQIFLASTIMADRNDKQYTTSIEPDIVVENKTTTENDEILETAIKWIMKNE